MRGKYSSVDYRKFINDRSLKFKSKVCGIINIGNNCYLNSGLQIIASCEELIKELKKNNDFSNKLIGLLNEAFDSILYKNIYDPERFIEYFCSINYDFIKGSQACSQNFIRTLIRNINDFCSKTITKNYQYNPIFNKEIQQYNKFIESNKNYPESNAISIFSCITKTHSSGKCPKCEEKIDDYSFSYFIDQNLYLDEFYDKYKCKFSEVLKANIGNESNLILDCPKCKKEIEIKEETKIIKLPEILIFTLERYQGPTNKVKIEPDKILDMKEYIDKSVKVDNTLYELFAINVRFGSTANFGHEICQVKRNGKWYEINDSNGYEINEISYFDSSYGLFYKKQNYVYPLKTTENNINKSKQMPNITIKNDCSNMNSYKINQNNLSIIKETIDKNIALEDIGYINCIFQIIALNKNLYSFLALFKKIKSNSIINETRKIISDILNNKKPNFIEIIKSLNENKQNSFYEDNKNSLDYLKKLVNIINEESLGAKEVLIGENKDYGNNQDKKYLKFINENKIYPQSKIYNIFSFLTRHYSYGKCTKCKRNIEGNNSYDNELNYLIYLPKYEKNKKIKYQFSKILENNIGSGDKKEMTCPHCGKRFYSNEITKIIKLPEIFIFHLNRFVESNKFTNKIEVIPDNELVMDSYCDYMYKMNCKNIKYKLFAVYIMKDNTNGMEHICQVEKDGKWYEFSNETKKPIEKPSYYKNSIGLYYKRC